MSPNLFLNDLAHAGRVFHGVFGVVAAGLSVHLAVCVWRSRAGGTTNARTRGFAKLCLLFVTLAMASGLAVYPNFRYFRRALFLDGHAPAISNLFDLKENMAVLVLPFIVLSWALTRVCREEKGGGRKILMISSGLASATLLAVAVLGFVVGLTRAG